MILVAIGANLPGPWGTPEASCRRAVAALARLPGLRLEACSSWHCTAPDPPSGQPDYVNGVARLSGSAGAARLLRLLHGIEAQGGRVRGVRNAARTLDLDLIDLDGLVRAAPDPVLPHPRAHLRLFVLLPLAEVAPRWRHPGSARPVRSLIAEVREGCGAA